MMKGPTVLHVQNSRPALIQVAISQKTLILPRELYTSQINSCAGAYGNKQEAYCTVSSVFCVRVGRLKAIYFVFFFKKKEICIFN